MAHRRNVRETSGPQREHPYEIFICYRRSLSAYHAAQLYRELFNAFGEVVFVDHNCLEGGELWTSRIDEVIRDVNAVIVLMGPDWLGSLKQRHDDERDDEVVRELDFALRQGKPLFPVLLDGARVPAAKRIGSLSGLFPDFQRYPKPSSADV